MNPCTRRFNAEVVLDDNILFEIKMRYAKDWPICMIFRTKGGLLRAITAVLCEKSYKSLCEKSYYRLIPGNIFHLEHFE